jgi:N-formylglutamate deformylase
VWPGGRAPWRIVRGDGPVIATAIHAGHDVRPEVARYLAVSPEARRREEDPLTELWTTIGDSSVVVFRSRFEFDLNRPRENAIVKTPEAAWGLDVWQELPPAEILACSMAEYDAFYHDIQQLIGRLLLRHGRLLVLDLHSYNHRRHGPAMPAENPTANPDINVGTGTMQREQWAVLVDAFIAALRRARVQERQLDVRENIKFLGGHFPRWLHSHYPSNVCVLSIECKKVFMDEWAATAEIGCLNDLRGALFDATTAARALLLNDGF